MEWVGNIEATFNEMLNELDMIHEEFTKAVRTKIVRPKLFLQCQPCEITTDYDI